jgi:hypothetical protein
MSSRQQRLTDAPAWVSASVSRPSETPTKTRRTPTATELAFERRGYRAGLRTGVVLGFFIAGPAGFLVGLIGVTLYLAAR